MRLKDFRKSKGINQEEMARIVGTSTSYYCKVESNFQNPSYSFLFKLKKAFPHLSIDELFFENK